MFAPYIFIGDGRLLALHLVFVAVSIKDGLRTADHGLRTGYKIRTRYKMRTPD